MADSVDRISDLPVPVLHHILSYLPNTDSARTSVLSKQWNSVRKSFPVVEFQQPESMKAMPFNGPQFKERLRELLDRADRSLQYFVQNKLRIKKLVLHASRIDYDSALLLNPWLSLALHNGISDLCFYVNAGSERDEDSHIALPQTTFAVNSSLLGGPASKFFRLEKLTLYMVYLSEHIVSDIIKNCPGISVLCLRNIRGLKTLSISKLDKLVSVTVSLARQCEELKRITVDTVSLERFSFSVPQSYQPCEIDLSSCSNLRKLELFNSTINSDQFHEQLSKLPLLEVLDVSLCGNLKRIRLSLQWLKHLRVYRCYNIRSIKIDGPALSSFDFTECQKWPKIALSKLRYPYKTRERVAPRVEVGWLDLTKFYVDRSDFDRLLSSCHPKTVSITSILCEGGVENTVTILCKMLMQREEKYRCFRSHCKCWRHRLKEAKIESIELYGVTEDQQFPLSLDTFSSIPTGSEVRFRLDWDLSALEGAHHSLDFLDRLSIRSDCVNKGFCKPSPYFKDEYAA